MAGLNRKCCGGGGTKNMDQAVKGLMTGVALVSIHGWLEWHVLWGWWHQERGSGTEKVNDRAVALVLTHGWLEWHMLLGWWHQEPGSGSEGVNE